MSDSPKPWSPSRAFARLMRGNLDSLRGVAGWAFIAASWVAAWPLWSANLFTRGSEYRRYVVCSLLMIPAMAYVLAERGFGYRFAVIGYGDPRAWTGQRRSKI